MSIYEKCVSTIVGPCTPQGNEQESVSLVSSFDVEAIHITVPSFLKSELSDCHSMGLSYEEPRVVYYISDIHLLHHIVQHFPNGASDEQIVEYIHCIVEDLFRDELGDAVKSFRSPVVLFGGDVASSYGVAEVFYRDFVLTWERIADDRYMTVSEVYSPLEDELSTVKELLDAWEEKHSWAKDAQKPLEEYSDSRVPRRIKDLLSRQGSLEDKMRAIREGLNLGFSWKRDYNRCRAHPFIYAILGNHELWDFDSCESCEAAYSTLFKSLGIRFLNSRIDWLGSARLPIRMGINRATGKSEALPLKREDDPQSYDEQLLLTGNYLIVGGLGFAAMNPSFNAHQGIYGKAIDWDEEHFRCDHWRRLFSEAVDEARKYHCSLVVLTHTPVSDWCRELQDSSNIVFFNGHTHRNVAIGGENNTYIFSDNQIGYKGTHFRFKKAILHIPRNPFAADPDGYREITCDEYKEYYRFVGGVIPKTGTIEKQIKQNEAKLYIIKKDGYVGFFLGSPKGVYICNGGVPKKIGSAESLDKYYSNFSSMISKYITALSPLRHVQEQLSAYIKSFGGTGKIHGTIVDIDYQNHVMISDTLTYYNSPVFGLIKTYEDIGSLLHDHCPQLEERFIKIGNAPLIPVANELTCGTSEYEFVDIKNSPYAVSRRVNALQRLFDKRILRDWNPEMEE